MTCLCLLHVPSSILGLEMAMTRRNQIVSTDRRDVPMTNSRVGERGLFQIPLHPFSSCGKAAFAGALAVLCSVFINFSSANAGPALGDLRGFTRSAQGVPLPGVQVLVHSVGDNTDLNIISDSQGAYLVENLRPGRYELRAAKEGLASSVLTTIDLRPQEDLQVDMTLDSSSGSKKTANSSLTADLRTPEVTANSEPAPLTDREKLLLERLDRLEQRLEAMESKDVKAAAPAPTVAAQPAPVVPQSRTIATTNAAPVMAAPTAAAPVQLTPAAAAPAKHTLLASLEDAIGIKSAEKPLALPAPRPTQAPAAAPAAPQHVLPEALEAQDQSDLQPCGR